MGRGELPEQNEVDKMEIIAKIEDIDGICVCGMDDEVYEVTLEDGAKVPQCGQCLQDRIVSGTLGFASPF